MNRTTGTLQVTVTVHKQLYHIFVSLINGVTAALQATVTSITADT